MKMTGQRVLIKVLSIEYLNLHKLWSCKYIVVSRKSLYFGCVDKAFSINSLDMGKTYYVKFNKNNQNPMIEKVYRESNNKKLIE